MTLRWIILVASAVFEAVWATALSLSDGLTQPLPTTVFFVACVISMLGLAYATPQIPIGTAYAVWVGIGAALTVGYSMLTGADTVTPWKLIFISGIILAVVGLKLAPEPRPRSAGTE